MKIRRRLRSARVSALSEEERRAEMREAQERHVRHDDAGPGQAPAGHDGAGAAQSLAGDASPPRAAGG